MTQPDPTPACVPALLPIDDGVPIPETRGRPLGRGAPVRATLRQLQIGQSFFVSHALLPHRQVGRFIHYEHVRTDRRFTHRKEGDGQRIWRVEDARAARGGAGDE